MTVKNTALPNLQSALHHRPGKYCAVVLLDRKKAQQDKHVLHALASMMKCLQEPTMRPHNLHVLCAVSPRLAGQTEPVVLPLKKGCRQMPLTQNDALLQVSAMTRSDLLYALRLCQGILRPVMRCIDEILGGQLRFDQEPFGFYHGNEDELDQLHAVARIPEGPLAGGSWLLYQLYEQRLPEFYHQPVTAQEDVMGAPALNTPQTPPRKYPDSAHTRVAHHTGDHPAMVRRGFAYRHRGEEGTAFLAASANPERFKHTLTRMLERDALLNFTEALQGGVYFIPPNGDWLDPSAAAATPPADVSRLPLRPHTPPHDAPIALQDYTVSAHFTQYIDTLRAHTFFDGPVGNMHFHPDILTLLHAINAVSSGATLTAPPEIQGGDTPLVERLNTLMQDSLADANLFNAVTGKYMTVG